MKKNIFVIGLTLLIVQCGGGKPLQKSPSILGQATPPSFFPTVSASPSPSPSPSPSASASPSPSASASPSPSASASPSPSVWPVACTVPLVAVVSRLSSVPVYYVGPFDVLYEVQASGCNGIYQLEGTPRNFKFSTTFTFSKRYTAAGTYKEMVRVLGLDGLDQVLALYDVESVPFTVGPEIIAPVCSLTAKNITASSVRLEMLISGSVQTARIDSVAQALPLPPSNLIVYDKSVTAPGVQTSSGIVIAPDGSEMTCSSTYTVPTSAQNGHGCSFSDNFNRTSIGAEYQFTDSADFVPEHSVCTSSIGNGSVAKISCPKNSSGYLYLKNIPTNSSATIHVEFDAKMYGEKDDNEASVGLQFGPLGTMYSGVNWIIAYPFAARPDHCVNRTACIRKQVDGSWSGVALGSGLNHAGSTWYRYKIDITPSEIKIATYKLSAPTVLVSEASTTDTSGRGQALALTCRQADCEYDNLSVDIKGCSSLTCPTAGTSYIPSPAMSCP